MRLLIAEDVHELSSVLKTLLEHTHYTVDTVDNGTDALSYALTGVYDGILLDIMMPGMDGLSVLRELRRRGGAHTGADADCQERSGRPGDGTGRRSG